MWATFFWKSGHLASFSDGWHFAGVSHTALGYGDVVLPKPWGMPVLSAFLGCCISAKWGAYLMEDWLCRRTTRRTSPDTCFRMFLNASLRKLFEGRLLNDPYGGRQRFEI